jgi:hypothetical protein
MFAIGLKPSIADVAMMIDNEIVKLYEGKRIKKRK